MSHMTRVLSMKPETIVVDKYGGAEFTVKEVAKLAMPILLTDSKKAADEFCERFERKEVK